ncbi:MAG: hypothetical protein V8S87_02595 [Oscillospiraceae bacterium]
MILEARQCCNRRKALAQRVREETPREAAALPRKAGLAVVLSGTIPLRAYTSPVRSATVTVRLYEP